MATVIAMTIQTSNHPIAVSSRRILCHFNSSLLWCFAVIPTEPPCNLTREFNCLVPSPSPAHCVPKFWVCDGEADCGSGIDEHGCNPTTGNFLSLSGLYLSELAVEYPFLFSLTVCFSLLAAGMCFSQAVFSLSCLCVSTSVCLSDAI